MSKSPEFIVDRQGKRVRVILDIEEYNRFVEALEDLEDIRSADEAKASPEAPIPLQQALDEIERSRK